MTALSQPLNADEVARIRLARAKRRDFFKESLFLNPAWDILLTLYAKHLAHERAVLADVLGEIDAPFSTACRWVRTLEEECLVALSSDDGDEPQQQRITLSDSGSSAMHSYFGALRSSQLL